MQKGATGSKKTLNIGMVFPVMEGGGTTHLEEVIPRLRERGYRVILVTDSKYGHYVEADAFKTFRVWPTPDTPYRFMPSAMWNIFKTLRGCDIIHIHTYPHFLADYLTIARPFHKIPVIITFHGSFHQYTSFKLRYFKRLHNMCMLRFEGFIDKFIAVSHAERNEVIKRGIPEQKVEVIYNGVSNEYAKVKRIRGDQSRGKKVLYLGRLTNSKNPGLLVEAMRHVIGEGKDTRLILAGADWGEREKLENLASKLGIKEYTEFTGEVTEEQKIKLLASCDVFVHPSLQDIFSLSLIEASTVGLPVVAFNVGGFSEMITNGQTGILVDDLTPKGLSEAILKILNDEKLAKEMGEEAQKYTLSKFSWEETVNGLERVYCEVLETKRA